MSTLTRKQELILFTGFLTLFEELHWKPTRESKKTWIPESRTSQEIRTKEKSRGKTRIEMEKACLYLARGELNQGLDPKKVQMCFQVIKNWKYWFTQAMSDKKNLQLEEACQKRLAFALRAGKNLVCEHADKHVLGKKGAAALADNIFRSFYDTEVRALRDTGDSPFFTRSPGPIEFGESTAELPYLQRQHVEIPTGPYYSSKEDENASGWSMTDMTEMNSGDDEFVETEHGNQLIVDYASRNELYGDLRRELMRCNSRTARDQLIKRIEQMGVLDRISSYQVSQLKWFNNQILSYKFAKSNNRLTSQTSNAQDIEDVQVEY